MSVIRLFCRDLHVGPNSLSAEESHHAISSVRLHAGDVVTLFDGTGGVASGLLQDASKKGVVISVRHVDAVAFDLTCRLTVAVAMPRTHRQGYLIEKCTELGVAGIWSMLTDRGVAEPGPVAVDKWTRRAIEAAKQSGRCWLPEIKTAQPFASVMASSGEFDMALWLDRSDDATPFDQYLKAEKPGSVLAIIGPEGGWSDDERAQARSVGLRSATLAPTVLRTETAAVAACALVASCA